MAPSGNDRTKAIRPDEPVMIAGPTAAGKSGLALLLAERLDGIIANADALQVYANWRVLTARPGPEDTARAPHLLYGHVARDEAYSVGKWLRDLKGVITNHSDRPLIVVGGTGLYFTSVFNGLSTIPDIPVEVRNAADSRLHDGGIEALRSDLARHDPETLARIDADNPARVQRAWEVWTATGRGLGYWHDQPRAGLFDFRPENAFVLDAPKDWLTARIETRLRAMVDDGALDECRANLAQWDPALPSSRAIGATQLIAHLNDEKTLDAALDEAVIATRQYAKRQRTWFRSKMADWTWLDHSVSGWG